MSLYVDKGSEFFSTRFKNYCKDTGIKLIFSTSLTKAALVERCQRSLQSIIYKYLNRYSTKRYIDKLEDVVKTYNSRVHRSLGMSPYDAYKPENHDIVMKKHEEKYKFILNKKSKPSYHLNDKVRIIRLSQPSFKIRSYQPHFTREIFQISAIDTRLPLPRYHLKDLNNDELIGSFREHELSLAT